MEGVGWSSLFFGGLRAARSHWLRRRRERRQTTNPKNEINLLLWNGGQEERQAGMGMGACFLWLEWKVS